MKEQDLRDKFEDVEKMTFHNHLTVKTSTNQCVQIAKDYADAQKEKEAIEFAKFVGQRYIRMHNVWCGIYQDQRNKENWITTKQLYQLFKNRENER